MGNIRGYLHPYLGEEGIAVGAIARARAATTTSSAPTAGTATPSPRATTRGRMMAELFGRETGYCHGRGGSMHVAEPGVRNLGANGVVAGGIGIAVGAAHGRSGSAAGREVVVAFCSDGASANGMWHESLNLAAIWDLPVIFVLENNQYAVSTPIRDSARVEHLSRARRGLRDAGRHGRRQRRGRRSTGRCRSRPPRAGGEGPTLIECMTFRHGGHHVNDPGLYLPTEELERWKARDPLDLLRARLAEAGCRRRRDRRHRRRGSRR